MRKILIYLLLLLILTGCSTVDVEDISVDPQTTPTTAITDAQTPAELIEEYVSILTSEDFDGRMAGTHGNDQAVEWLNTKLSSFGIDPYNEEEFNMGFPGVSRTFIRSEVT
ncbi:MAG: lipoprotein, partial [Oscillospiraceae bacterium]|nr:lipoprotein [Oscillospiraceae bacterium]